MKMTIAEFATAQNITNHAANGLVSFLMEKEIVTKTDEMRPVLTTDGKLKRGRPSVVFEFPETVSITL